MPQRPAGAADARAYRPAGGLGNRDVHYDAIRQPQDPEKFIGALQKRLREVLTRFDTALELGTTGGVDIVRRHGEPWIKVSPLGKQEEPENLRENLRTAITGEHNEATTVYPGFVKRATAVGDTAAARYWRNTAADEAKHAAAFQKALDQLR
nr:MULTISPECIES: ferritin family protein [unclassified Streptomyces]